MYDEVLAVNGQDVSTMDHGDIVTLIKSSGTTIRLTVQQPEGQPLPFCELEGQPSHRSLNAGNCVWGPRILGDATI